MPTSALVALIAAASPLAPGDHARTIHVAGRERSYLVHVPAPAPRPAPVVLAYHGGLSNARVMARFSGLSETADAERFVVVYPEGSGRFAAALTWNGGGCCGYARQQAINDVGFTRALLDDLGSVLPIDDRRIFATGISNGAIMAYRVAAELSDRIAAIAPVAGSLEVTLPSSARPTPIVHFHGTQDEHLPIQGGRGSHTAPGLHFRSLSETLAPWLRLNGCGETPRETVLPDRVSDGTRVLRREYPGCRAEVAVYVIEGGGHTWPGRPPRVRFLGKATEDISANAVMWAFFAAHPRR